MKATAICNCAADLAGDDERKDCAGSAAHVISGAATPGCIWVAGRMR